MANPTCTVPHCDKPARSGVAKYCGMHYRRVQRYGDADFTQRDRRPLAVRWRDTYVEDENGCWNWPFVAPNGYGFTSDGTAVWMHRWVYEYVVGPIPAGLQLDHLCRNRKCCNPGHLEPVTQQENVRRGIRPVVTHCPQGHDYAEHGRSVAKASGAITVCRPCESAAKARWREKKRLQAS